MNIIGESVSANVKVEEFPGILDKLLVEGNYFSEQIANTDETFLFWKQKPERTFTHKEANSHQISGLFRAGKQTCLGAMLLATD